MCKVLKYAIMALCVFGMSGCGDNVESNEKNISQKAKKALEKLCDEGVATVCNRFAESMKNELDKQKALEYYEKGCNGKPAGDNTYHIGISCLRIAGIYAEKLEGDKALQYYTRACEISGNCSEQLKELDPSGYLQAQSKACLSLNTPIACDAKDNERQLLDEYCTNGASVACESLLRRLEYEGVSCNSYSSDADECMKRRIASMIHYVSRICELDIDKCLRIDRSFLDNINGIRYSFIEKSCQNGHIESCRSIYDYVKYYTYGDSDVNRQSLENLQNMAIKQLDTLCKSNKSECQRWYKQQNEYEYERSYNKSEEKLVQFCENGNGYSCISLGDIYTEKLNGQQAIAYYKKGCENESEGACSKVWNTQKDEKVRDKEIIPFFKKLCENGNNSGCSALRMVEQESYSEYDIRKLSLLFDGDGLPSYYHWVSQREENEAYWLGYYQGDSRKTKKAVSEIKKFKNEARSEFLKHLPQMCQNFRKDACDTLWEMHNK